MRVTREVGVDGVLDIETEGWDRFVLGALLTAGGEYFSTRDPEALAMRLCRSRGDWWAHNGGHYDALWFLSILHAWKVPKAKIALAGSRVTCVEFAELRLRDSYALVPLGLAKAAELGGAAKLSTGFQCECGQDCGGYCRIRVGMPEADYRTLDGYLEADCRATLAMLRAVSSWCAERGVPMRGTIGGTAWADVRQRTGVKPASWARGVYELTRAGYYGGRVEVFRPRAESGWRYDRNSSYPAALVETELPVGVPRVYGKTAGAQYRADREGVYQATVVVPADTFIPPLPLRLADRLAYPTGRFEGVWTAPHLRRAEERGAAIASIGWGIVWPERRRELRPWCEWVWSERAKAAPGSAWNKWIKLLGNSLTGKMAQRSEQRGAMLGLPRKTECPGGKCDPRSDHRHARCCDYRCTGRCGVWSPLGPSGRIWTRTEYRRPSSGHIQFAAYLTASAEIELDRQLCEVEESAVYCDTDSAYSTAAQTRKLGDGLGEWKHEGWFRSFVALAPKLYRYIDPNGGKETVRAKGMSKLTARGMRDLEGGGAHVVDTGVASFLSAAARGDKLFRRSHLSRSLGAQIRGGVFFGGRQLGSDGRTYPMRAEELLGLTDDTEVVSSLAGDEGGSTE